MGASFHLRPYRAEDEDAAIELWRLTWQQAYPSIDFTARVPWWRERWRNELVPNASIIVAEQADTLVGFVTIDGSGYLDQLVVRPDHWGSKLATALVDEAKRLSPRRRYVRGQQGQRPRHPLLRAQRLWACRREDVNPTSGRPVLRMNGDRDCHHRSDGAGCGKPTAQLNNGDGTMTRAEFAKGSATFLVVIVAGLLSETYLDRHLAASRDRQESGIKRWRRSIGAIHSVDGMRRERRLVEKLAVVERTDTVAEMPRGSLAAQLPRRHMRRNSTPITSTT